MDQPGEYEREHWERSIHEKYSLLEELKVNAVRVANMQTQGNDHYRAGRVDQAADKYEVALGYAETVLCSADGTPDMVRCT